MNKKNMTEKFIPILFGKYLLGNAGSVISCNYNKTGVAQKLIPQMVGDYLAVRINERKKVSTIHRLVATFFVTNPLNKPEVNHEDGNKLNNWFWNLSWVTKSENGLHAYRIGLSKPNKTNLGNFGGRAFRKEAIRMTMLDGTFIKEFSNIREAAIEYNILETSISNCLNKRSKTAGGFRWEYLN